MWEVPRFIVHLQWHIHASNKPMWGQLPFTDNFLIVRAAQSTLGHCFTYSTTQPSGILIPGLYYPSSETKLSDSQRHLRVIGRGFHPYWGTKWTQLRPTRWSNLVWGCTQWWISSNYRRHLLVHSHVSRKRWWFLAEYNLHKSPQDHQISTPMPSWKGSFHLGTSHWW